MLLLMFSDAAHFSEAFNMHDWMKAFIKVKNSCNLHFSNKTSKKNSTSHRNLIKNTDR